MIDLVFVVCLRFMPDQCEERVLTYLSNGNPMACLMQAQPELAQWALTHPDYTVSRWSCEGHGHRPSSA